ncbi:protein LIAT1 [Sphaeramia orbicularis]|uniref:protein LIAT1 n=1 Tax=Sphaeramia orbicularis TaxID=375764 RepID=UPI00117FCFBA|nr:protein LIAT1 [Sphaeramia orbicularis]
MAEDKNSEQLQPPKTMDCKKKKKKKKKRKKAPASNTPPKHTEKPHTVSVPPETSPVSLLTPVYPPQGRPPRLKTASRKDGERLGSSGRTSEKKPSKDSPTDRTSTAPKQDRVEEPSPRTRESLRWEEVLEDPQAEEERLELYRANRRQRYMAHREMMLREAYAALRQTVHKEKSEEKHRCEQEKDSLLRLSKDLVKKEGKTEPYYFKMQVMPF